MVRETKLQMLLKLLKSGKIKLEDIKNDEYRREAENRLRELE